MDKLPFEAVKRKIIIRKEAETDPGLGTEPVKRPVKEIVNYGIVNIDKPKGPTSHQVSDYVQRILNIEKAGHSGTLDPGVTGVLPIAVGRATRIVQTLLKAGKEYVALMHLHKKVDEAKIKNLFREFTGKIKQLPPIKSSVKRVEREREIYYLKIIEIEEKDVLFKVGCQAGTYIRKLIHDMGEKIGTGAHMVELRRTKAGPFDETTLATLQDLTDAFWYWTKEGNERYIKSIIQPVESAISHLPKIWVVDSAVNTLCHGANLNTPGIARLNSDIRQQDMMAVMTLKSELICLGTALTDAKEMLKEKGMVVKTDRVFMLPDTYKII